ncbi:MAG: Smr/MutS family protein [Candidatus Rifleibacteriota bacterium]
MSNEIDLHGLTAADALETFINYYNSRVSRSDLSMICVIHGYGSSGTGGKILIKLRNFLAAHTDKLSFTPGEDFISRNPGQTMVKPRKMLPASVDLLGQEILAFCEQPKTRTKIAGKFRRHGETRIKEALAELEKKNLIVSFNKQSHKVYQTRTNQ